MRSICSAASWARVLVAPVLLAGCVALEPKTVTPDPAPAARAVILVSDRVDAYQEVADALSARLPGATIHRLDGNDGRARALIESLRRVESPVVAIGPAATRVAAGLAGRIVVFCQYFRPDLAGAAIESLRGVGAVPPAAKQLQAWKALYPNLRRVALITGPGANDFVQEAKRSAARLAIALELAPVRSDRELLYAIKYMDPAVQGIWLLPDHRVMSADSLRPALAHALRQGRQTLVFAPELLAYGGLLSVEADPQDVAERVLEQLCAAEGEAPRIVPLRRARTRVNLEIARQLGLEVPARFEGGPHVF